MSKRWNFGTGTRIATLALAVMAWSATDVRSQDEKQDKKEKQEKKPDPALPNANAPKYTIGQCLAIGMERQPNLKAARAIIAATEGGRQGLDDIGPIASLFAPGLKYRKEQSCNGITAARIEMAGAEQEVTYAIVRTYYSMVYAREQYKLINDLIVQLNAYYDQVKTIVNSKDGGTPDINRNTQDRLSLAINAAIIRRNEAEAGILQAAAALREAMGLEPTEQFEIADSVLPEISATIERDTVISLAVTKRAEVQLAAIGADVARIEVLAQWADKFGKKVQTFAVGSDLHAIPVPLGSREKEYRPEALGPRMPMQFVGNRGTRTSQANQYALYADALREKTRNLITLEAENGFQKYKQAARDVESTRGAVKDGKALIERLRAAQGAKLTETLMLSSEGLVTTTNAQFNQTLIDQITALANLERITGGGIRVNYPGR